LSNAQIAGFDLLVSLELFRLGGIDHLALAHHVHVIDQFEGEVRALLDQQDRQAFFLQLPDRFPETLDDDRRQPF
jgi:hypothetical protein